MINRETVYNVADPGDYLLTREYQPLEISFALLGYVIYIRFLSRSRGNVTLGFNGPANIDVALSPWDRYADLSEARRRSDPDNAS